MTASNVAGLEREVVDPPLHEARLGDAVAVAQALRLGDLLAREVDARGHARSGRPGRRAEHVGSRAGAEIERRLALGQRSQLEVVADTGVRGDRLGRDAVEQRRRVAEVLGELAADLKVKVRHLLAGHVPVHLLHFRLQLAGVDQRARVGLRQRRGARHLLGVGHSAADSPPLARGDNQGAPPDLRRVPDFSRRGAGAQVASPGDAAIARAGASRPRSATSRSRPLRSLRPRASWRCSARPATTPVAAMLAREAKPKQAAAPSPGLAILQGIGSIPVLSAGRRAHRRLRSPVRRRRRRRRS